MMMKVKRFLYVYINSIIPEDSYYHKLTRRPIWFSLQYLFFVTFFTYFLFLLLGVVKTNMFAEKRQLAQNLLKAVKAFPDDYVIDIQNGKLMTNYPKPYFVWLAEGDKQHLLAVVDETGTADKIRSYNSLFLFTSNTMTYAHGKTYTTLSYNKTALRITKPWMVKTERYVEKIYTVCRLGIVAGALFVIPLLLFLFNVLYCLFASLISYICWRSFPQKTRVSFQRILQLSTHAISFPLLLVSFMLLLGVPITRLPFTFIVILLIFTNTAVYESYIDYPATHHT